MSWNHSHHLDNQFDHHSDHPGHHNDHVIALAAGCFLSVIGVTTVLSNGVLLLALLVDPIKQLNTPPMYLVVNRAIADFLTGILVDPLYVIYYVTCYYGNVNSTAEFLGRFVSYITVNTAMWTTVTLACERYLCIKKPFKYTSVASRQHIVAACCLIWLYATITAFTALSGHEHNIYLLLGTQLNLSIPSLMITALSYSIYKFLRNQRHNDILRFLPSQGSQRSELVAKLKQDKRMLNTVILIIVLLFSCFAPYVIFAHVSFFTHAHYSAIYDVFNRLSQPFVFLNSSINPFVYAWRHNVFRRSIQEIFRKRPRNDIGMTSSSVKQRRGVKIMP